MPRTAKMPLAASSITAVEHARCILRGTFANSCRLGLAPIVSRQAGAIASVTRANASSNELINVAGCMLAARISYRIL